MGSLACWTEASTSSRDRLPPVALSAALQSALPLSDQTNGETPTANGSRISLLSSASCAGMAEGMTSAASVEVCGWLRECSVLSMAQTPGETGVVIPAVLDELLGPILLK